MGVYITNYDIQLVRELIDSLPESEDPNEETPIVHSLVTLVHAYEDARKQIEGWEKRMTVWGLAWILVPPAAYLATWMLGMRICIPY